MNSERRESPRHTFIAFAEVLETDSGARLDVRTSDLSSTGCYLDMINPLPVHTKVTIVIAHQGQVITIGAVVARIEPNMGMGMKFTDIEPSTANVLESWIRQAAGN